MYLDLIHLSALRMGLASGKNALMLSFWSMGRMFHHSGVMDFDMKSRAVTTVVESFPENGSDIADVDRESPFVSR